MIDMEYMVACAWNAGENSYSPYSGFHVGACLLTESGNYYTGCNVENISYGPTNCAERTAFFTAVAAGERKFLAIAIVGERADGSQLPDSFTYPCGVCRQVMLEFCDPKTFVVILGSRCNGIKTYLLDELIPHGFGAY